MRKILTFIVISDWSVFYDNYLYQMFCERSAFNNMHHRGLSLDELCRKKNNFGYNRNANLALHLATSQTPTFKHSAADYSPLSQTGGKVKEFPPQFFKYCRQKVQQFEESQLKTQLKSLQNVKVNGIKSKVKSIDRPSGNILGSSKFDRRILNNYFNSSEENSLLNNTILDKSSNLLRQSVYRKTISMMAIKKRQKKKELNVQREKERIDEEFRRNKSIPIHHSQLYFNKVDRSKTEESRPDEKKIIADVENMGEVIRKRFGLTQQVHLQTNMIKVVKGNHIDQRNQQKPSQKYSPKRSLQLKKKKSKNQKSHMKEEQFDFGPWKRANTNEFDGLI